MSKHVDYLRTLQKHYVDEANVNFGTEAEYQYGGDALCVKDVADHLAALEQRLAEVEAKYATLLDCVRLYAAKGNWLGHVFNTFPGSGYEPAQEALRKVE